MKNVVGQITSKEDFYQRDREINRIMRALEAGGNLQLTAPRRVGKSSILVHLKESRIDGYIFIYVEVESARNKNEFYRKIYKEIIKSEYLNSKKNIWKQISDASSGFLKRLKGVKIGALGAIEFNESEVDYEEELLNLLSGINLDGERLIIMIDEFPEVILNIVDDRENEVKEAKTFLQSTRELRNNDAIRGKVQFIYTGSNSLNITASNLDCSVLINDLNSIPVYPLKPDEAKDFVRRVLENYGYKINQIELDYLINKVEWLIPFYLQLMIQEIISDNLPNDPITTNVIDKAFNSVMEQRNDHHFDHYVKRLKRLFTGPELIFVGKFLNTLSQQNEITKDEAFNISNGLISEAATKKVLNTLKYDAYILQDTESERYKFNSPILKIWWYKHEC